MLNQKFSSGTKKEKWELGGAEKESGRREKKSVEDRGGEGRGREEYSYYYYNYNNHHKNYY